jgi:hypothetical protein
MTRAWEHYVAGWDSGPAHHYRNLGGIILRKMLSNLHVTPCDARECRR